MDNNGRYTLTKTGTMIPDAEGYWRKQEEVEANRVPHSMQHVIELQAMNNRLGAQIEALQRERGEWFSNSVAEEARANDLERDCKDLQSDIEDERAKAGNLLKKIAYWEKRHRTYRELAEENMNLKSDELSALQGLVETIKCELFDRYDGAPDSPTRWMGSLIRDIKIAQALPATPTERGQE